MANSPAFAGAESVHTIQRALVRLGARTVRGVVATAATMGLFEDVGGLGARFRQHCAGVAGLSHRLAKHASFRDPGTAFICGLMHDIGKLLALQCGEITYADFPTDALETPRHVHALEREGAGYDHAVLGGHVLAHWGMPDPIPEVVALHHQCGRAWDHENRTIAALVALVTVADDLEYALAGGLDPAQTGARVARTGAASYLDLVSADIERLWGELVDARESTIAML